MAETINKLQPDRDLLCYFLRPSAIAALSSTSPNGFTVSGSWRQQFDWAVVEWNRDNAFEHPSLRFLPDGDLSGLTLTYQETRTACLPLDSDIYPTVDWPYLRIWLDSPSGEIMRRVRIADYATILAGGYTSASATFQLNGAMTSGDIIEIAWNAGAAEHYYYTLTATDTADTALTALASTINQLSTTVTASELGGAITLTLSGAPVGANGNRVGVYATVTGTGTESWLPAAQPFSGGVSPSAWQVTLPFGSLVDADSHETFAATGVRKMRWTYAADLQMQSFVRTEFSVIVSGWTVTGTNRTYSVAGPNARRVEDDAADLTFTGHWSLSPAAKGNVHGAVVTGTNAPQNFSGGSIALSTFPSSTVALTYAEPSAHQLYLGTRITNGGAPLSVSIDGGAAFPITTYVNPAVDYVDTLARISLGAMSAGQHTIVVTHAGASGTSFYLDFFEIAHPTTSLPDYAPDPTLTLATDWDTDHSIALAPERTAWLVSKLGFHGRANHYIGALWWFEMTRVGQVYATGSVTFGGTSTFGTQTTLSISGFGYVHVHLQGDDANTVAKAFEQAINNGSTSVWAQASGTVLQITSRVMGVAGNATTLAVSVQLAGDGSFVASASAATLLGGIEGAPTGVAFQDTYLGWRTDLGAAQLVNRAARDWNRSYFTALKSYGIQATCAFSTELQFVDPSPAAGMAQRYPDGSPCQLNTPAIQTNFSPTSLAYWRECYSEIAQLMIDAGQIPYLQFGEVQWWYFPPPGGTGLPFYDSYSTSQFQAQYGRPMTTFVSTSQSLASLPAEAAFLPSLVGAFTTAIAAFVAGNFPTAKFEVLYPPDVNNSALMGVANLPKTSWTSGSLACLKTENFTYTGDRNLDLANQSVQLPGVLGFPHTQASHLIGIGDYTTPWMKEVGLAMAAGLESIVLFALDQFCLVGYPVDFYANFRRSLSLP